jgi:DNA gyrase/topoisomerase IV subunit A
MEKAAKEITTTEEIIVSPEESVDEVKEEIKKVPATLGQELHRLAAVWERVSDRSRVSRSDVVVGSGLGGMYGAKFQALAKEHEQVRPDKG